MRLTTLLTRLAFVLFAVCMNSLAYASEGGEDEKKDTKDAKSEKKTTAQPDVPGSLVIEVANNILTDAPESMKLNWMASWSVNVYYLFELPFGESAFSFNPGLGLSMENYRFDGANTLQNTNEDFNTEVVPLAQVIPGADNYTKSLWNMTFFDVPFEFRWYANPEFKRKSIKLAVGGKIGFRIDSKTKVVYKEFENRKKLKNKENFNFNSPRYGVYGRFGFGAVSLFYYYSLTEVFQNKRGPEETRAKVMMAGIAISGF